MNKGMIVEYDAPLFFLLLISYLVLLHLVSFLTSNKTDSVLTTASAYFLIPSLISMLV